MDSASLGENTQRLLEQDEARIEQQLAVIARLREHNRSTAAAEALLEIFREAQVERHQRAALRSETADADAEPLAPRPRTRTWKRNH